MMSKHMALGDLHVTSFEIAYRWDDGLLEFKVIDQNKGIEEKDSRIIELIREESVKILPRMLAEAHLKRAAGTFVVRIIGIEEPYSVQLAEWREPIDPDFTPLMKAAKGGDFEAVRRLLTQGMDVERTDQRGRTALMVAAQGTDVRIVKALLEAGADPNRVGPKGWTALFVATLNGRAETVEALLAAGASAHIRDEQGLTPLDYALQRKYQRIVASLRRAGARKSRGALGSLQPLQTQETKNCCLAPTRQISTRTARRNQLRRRVFRWREN